MKSKSCTLVLLLTVGALNFSGCGPATPQPTEIPTATPTQAAVEAPDPVRARDAALAHVSERYGEQAPALGLAWTEELTTPEGLVGLTTYQYTAEDWVVTVSYPIVRPDLTVYQVVVANDATGFHWEGQVDAAGRVTQALEGVLAARDAALTYVIEHYGAEAPTSGLSWMEENITPGWPDAPVPGWVEYQYTAEGWVVTVGHAVLPLEWIVYQITVSNQTTRFQWEGEVDAGGRVTETTAPTAAAEDEYVGWQTYTSAKFGYTLKHPRDVTMMGADLDESVQFVGPVANNEHWPWFSVDHFDSNFYHPPAGTDVHQWIADSSVSYDEMGPKVQVAGLPTVHLIYQGGPGIYASDDYYFIRGDQLFRITILHAGGKQDWDLYDKFLQSFTFP